VKGNHRDLVSVLKSELAFLESGGYWSDRLPSWRTPLILEDSPTCLNFNRTADRRPCRECILMQLVPGEHVSEKVPCRHIPLNEQGETLDSLYRSSTQEEIETVVANWLRAKIHELEDLRGESLAIRFHAPAKAKSASKL
jgi:hypothetical protein